MSMSNLDATQSGGRQKKDKQLFLISLSKVLSDNFNMGYYDHKVCSGGYEIDDNLTSILDCPKCCSASDGGVRSDISNFHMPSPP